MPWHSIHFYPLDNQDVFLVRSLRPFFQQHIWSTRGARAFFIRYQDEQGPHIRIRMRGEESWMENTLKPAFQDWQEGKGNWSVVPYTPETERFGGEAAMAIAEDYFHISSRVCLDRLAREQHTYGDSMFDALRMHTMAVHAAGMSPYQSANYFSKLTEQWLPLFFGQNSPEDAAFLDEIIAGFEKNFEAQKSELRTTLMALWKALDQDKFDKNQPEWSRWFSSNQLILKSLGDQLDRALPSLIHLTNNRLGINNQDEVYLNFILSKALV